MEVIWKGSFHAKIKGLSTCKTFHSTDLTKKKYITKVSTALNFVFDCTISILCVVCIYTRLKQDGKPKQQTPAYTTLAIFCNLNINKQAVESFPDDETSVADFLIG